MEKRRKGRNGEVQSVCLCFFKEMVSFKWGESEREEIVSLVDGKALGPRGAQSAKETQPTDFEH